MSVKPNGHARVGDPCEPGSHRENMTKPRGVDARPVVHVSVKQEPAATARCASHPNRFGWSIPWPWSWEETENPGWTLAQGPDSRRT